MRGIKEYFRFHQVFIHPFYTLPNEYVELWMEFNKKLNKSNLVLVSKNGNQNRGIYVYIKDCSIFQSP